MKKYFLLFFMLVTAVSYAQLDTIHADQRDPRYYYGGNDWWDYWCFHTPCVCPGLEYNTFRRQYIGPDLSEIARYCFTDTTLKIIGIAAPVYVGPASFDPEHPFVDTSLDHRKDEYFRIYQTDGYNMIKLAEKTYDLNSPSKIFCVAYDDYVIPGPPITHDYEEIFANLYEVYFDSAVTVTDSFYVSGTNYNNFKVPDSVLVRYDEYGKPIYRYTENYYYRPTAYFMSRANAALLIRNIGIPEHTYFKSRTLSNDSVEDAALENSWRYVPECLMFFNIFPIIDTGHYTHTPSDSSNSAFCPTPNGLRVNYLNDGSMSLFWNDVLSNGYELSLGREGSVPDDGNISFHSTPFCTLENLDTSLWYVAWVRTLCDSGRVSDWSDSIRFKFQNDTSSHNNAFYHDNVDLFTSLNPNPSHGRVLVTSSFRINKVFLYNMKGDLLFSKKINSLSSILDVSTLPKGTYIMVINTIRGVTQKKLVIN